MALVACCVFCAFESVAQWDLLEVSFLRKTASRPSGSVPSAPPTSPLAGTLWEFRFLGLLLPSL